MQKKLHSPKLTHIHIEMFIFFSFLELPPHLTSTWVAGLYFSLVSLIWGRIIGLSLTLISPLCRALFGLVNSVMFLLLNDSLVCIVTRHFTASTSFILSKAYRACHCHRGGLGTEDMIPLCISRGASKTLYPYMAHRDTDIVSVTRHYGGLLTLNEARIDKQRQKKK